jgi:hypothetical protein
MAISTRTRPGKTRKDQERSRCDVGSLCDVRERYLHPKMIDTEVESQLALHSVSRDGAKPAYRPSVAVAYTSEVYLRDAYRVSHWGPVAVDQGA